MKWDLNTEIISTIEFLKCLILLNLKVNHSENNMKKDNCNGACEVCECQKTDNNNVKR